MTTCLEYVCAVNGRHDGHHRVQINHKLLTEADKPLLSKLIKGEDFTPEEELRMHELMGEKIYCPEHGREYAGISLSVEEEVETDTEPEEQEPIEVHARIIETPDFRLIVIEL